jgi:hypothetical protein
VTDSVKALVAPTGPFGALNARLADLGIEAELCLVGGAVMIIAFDAAPETRHIRALFKPTRAVRDAADAVARDKKLTRDWLNEAVRRLLGTEGRGLGRFLERSNLRVYEAQGNYVLAMKAASLKLELARDADADLSYLLRSLGVSRVPEALERIGRYFGERQLPTSLPDRLATLLD